MIGQEKLLNKINKYTIETLPKSIMFIGESGCGKHTISEYISKKFDLPLVEISDKVDADTLIDYQQCPVKKLYLIDLSKFVEKQQNQFLKFIEEPNDSCYIILISESKIGVLPTILNRCTKYYFEQYTIEELKQVQEVSNPIIYNICKTPGQLIVADQENVTKLCKLCTAIITEAREVAYNRFLTISAQINYKEDYDKFDFNLFFNTMIYCAFNEYKRKNSSFSLLVYIFTVDFYQQIINKNIAKENFVLNYLTQLWQEIQKE